MDDAALMRVRENPDRRAAADEVLAAVPGWYHTIELTAGIATPGITSLDGLLPKVLPPRLDGLRCLDVGTFDGKYAFGMEDRGAREVVAIDVPDSALIDHPPLRREHNLETTRQTRVQPGDGFRAAAAARRSAATWVPCNVYDLSAEVVGGPVDFAVVATLLQHLRDPVGALERLLATLVPGGEAVLVETFDPRLTLAHPRRPLLDFRAARTDSNYTWHVPNLSGLRAWPRAAGFEVLPGRPVTHSLRGERLAARTHRLAIVRVRRPR